MFYLIQKFEHSNLEKKMMSFSKQEGREKRFKVYIFIYLFLGLDYVAQNIEE